MMVAKCLIIIPAYNEEDNIEKLISDLQKQCPQMDYLIINDCSTDSTKQICKKHHYHVLNLPINMGIGGAVQSGYRYARENGYAYAVQIDGDGQHDVTFLPGMLQKLENNEADIVVGSRFLEKEGFQSSAARRVGILFLSRLCYLLTGIHVKDITSGYRMVNSRFINIFADDYPADYPEPEAMVMAAVHGGRVLEYPVVMKERQGGESSITWKKSVYYMIKVSIAMFIRRLSLGIRREKG